MLPARFGTPLHREELKQNMQQIAVNFEELNLLDQIRMDSKW